MLFNYFFIDIYSISLEPALLLVYGPSYLAFGLMLLLIRNRPSKVKAVAHTVFALVLHGITSIILIAMKRMGDAWGGYSSNDTALLISIGGIVIILAVASGQIDTNK